MEGAIRLADGESLLDGRVEVCTNGYWGALHPPRVGSFDNGYPSTELEKAERICKQLGLPWECELVKCVHVCVCVYIEVRGSRKHKIL